MACAHDIFKVWLSLSFCPPYALQADLWVRTLDGPQEGSCGKRRPGQAVAPFPGEAAWSLCLLAVAWVSLSCLVPVTPTARRAWTASTSTRALALALARWVVVTFCFSLFLSLSVLRLVAGMGGGEGWGW